MPDPRLVVGLVGVVLLPPLLRADRLRSTLGHPCGTRVERTPCLTDVAQVAALFAERGRLMRGL